MKDGKVGFGIIGIGNMGSAHSQFITNLSNAEVAAAHPDYTLASHGKYYILGGSSVAPVSPSFSFGLDLPSWEAGD